jgi:hypothetical protein
MLAELKKGLGMKRQCLCSKTTTVLLERTVPKMYDDVIFHEMKGKIFESDLVNQLGSPLKN